MMVYFFIRSKPCHSAALFCFLSIIIIVVVVAVAVINFLICRLPVRYVRMLSYLCFSNRTFLSLNMKLTD
jgi:hypothetical protein